MRLSLSALLALPVAMLVAGCHVTKHGTGDTKNVDIGTPFGSLQVKSDDKATTDVGITPYPGAVLEKKHDKDSSDNNGADIHLSLGSLHFGLKVQEYTTPDAPEKVIAFYKKDLARYGAVLQCAGTTPVGEPTRTAEGLTCSDDTKQVNINVARGGVTVSHDMQLRTGSKQHMHVVGLEKKDGATKIGLVALDLPSGLHLNDEDDKQSN